MVDGQTLTEVGGAPMSSVNEQLKQLALDYSAKKISRRTLWKGAAGLGLSAAWIAALEKGALAGPAPLHSQLRGTAQDKSNTLIVAVAENVTSFDPAFTVGDKTSQATIQNTFDQLTQYQVVEKQAPDGTPYKTVDTGQIIGMLAETWEYDATDASKMVFHLRQGVKYANGDPFDANVALQGYQRIYETQAVSYTLLHMGDAVPDASSFSAPDANTFVIQMSKPNTLAALNNVMHNTSSLDPAEIEAHKTGDDPYAKAYFNGNPPTGNGPYKLDSYKPDDSLVLVANESYYGDKPVFTTVILKIVTDATQRVQLLQKGDVDFSTKIPLKEYEGLKADANIKVLSIPTPLVHYIGLNNSIAPFDKKEVRQAIAYATPYDDILEKVYLGQAQPAKSMVPNLMPTSDFSTNQYALNLDKAKELLVTAGFPDGKGLPEIKLSLANDDVQKERVAILMQDALKQIGMTITIEKLPYSQFGDLRGTFQLQAFVDEWLSWVNDPFYHLTWLTSSTSPTDWTKFSNARVDELITNFTLSDDAAGREAASKEIQAIVIDECPFIFLSQPNWIFYSRQDLNDYVYYNDELPRYYHFTRAAS